MDDTERSIKLQEMAIEELINYDKVESDERFILLMLCYTPFIKDYNFFKQCKFLCGKITIVKMFLYKLISRYEIILKLIKEHHLQLELIPSKEYEINDLISTIIENDKLKSKEEIVELYGLRCGYSVYMMLKSL